MIRAQKRAMGEALKNSKTSIEFRELDLAGTIQMVITLDQKHVNKCIDAKMINIIDHMFFFENKKYIKMVQRARAFVDFLQMVEENYDKIQIPTRGE